MNRKQRRAFDKAQKKADGSSKIANQVALFEKLPEMCLTCEKSFDKKSKEMAKTWNVVVKDKDTVRLYCPECWNRANEIIKEVMKNGGEIRG